MINNSVLDQDKFWAVLKHLIELKEPRPFSRILLDTSVSKWELNSFINFLSEIGCEFKIENMKEDKMFIPSQESPEFNLQFSLLEWVQFQAHFPKLSECDGKPYHDDFREKIEKAEVKYQEYDIFSPLVTLDNIFKEHQPSLIENSKKPSKEVLIFLEESILDQKVVQVNLEHRSYKIFPRKIVYFDGALNLIGEEILDKCLMNININHIKKSNEESESYNIHYSKLEVDEFVVSLRGMSENQIRLVLKIYSQNNFSLNFNDKFFENPCLLTNPEGDFIWAATLEPCEEIFEWLCDLGSSVEVLDPTSFKLEFIKYCEHKLKKLA
jgi:hypothetical protein